MKRIQTQTKKALKLARETIRSLDHVDLQNAQGGAAARSEEDGSGCGQTVTCTCNGYTK